MGAVKWLTAGHNRAGYAAVERIRGCPVERAAGSLSRSYEKEQLYAEAVE
jgi:hypothetical protein